MEVSDSNAQRAEEMRRRMRAVAVRAVRLVEALPRSTSGQVIGRQLLRAATSAAANYRAACRARSRAEFIAKMSIVVEETDETEFWIELLVETDLVKPDRVDDLLIEVRELLRMVSAARRTAQKNRRPT